MTELSKTRKELQKILLWSADGLHYINTQIFLDSLEDDDSEEAKGILKRVSDFAELIDTTRRE